MLAGLEGGWILPARASPLHCAGNPLGKAGPMLTAEQIRRYHDDGFIVVPGVVEPETVAALRSATDRIVAGAKAEIDQEAVRAKEQLREQVASLVVSGAEKILRREINTQAHADILATIKQDL